MGMKYTENNMFLTFFDMERTICFSVSVVHEKIPKLRNNRTCTLVVYEIQSGNSESLSSTSVTLEAYGICKVSNARTYAISTACSQYVSTGNRNTNGVTNSNNW